MPGHTWATSAVEAAAGDRERYMEVILRIELHSTLSKMNTIWDQR